MKILCIDGGTTNTRVRLVDNGRITDTERSSVGSSNKDNSGLKNACRDMIGGILARNHLAERDVSRIIATGMLTSELGLYCLPHTLLPADVHDLARNAVTIRLDELSSIPFVFTPGLRQA